MKNIGAIALVLWLALVLGLGTVGAFIQPPGNYPIPIAIGVLAPIAIFLAAYWAATPFHAFVTNADLPLATAIQAWRFGGIGFIALYRYGVLPGAFAWPAGLGDIAIGLTAPWIAWALVRRPNFAASRVFVVWNLLGILDLIVAVGSAALNIRLANGVPGEVTVAPMAQLPLVLIPAFLVPLFIMLHLTALFQARLAAASERSPATNGRSPNKIAIAGY
jgi:hypothetical protein